MPERNPMTVIGDTVTVKLPRDTSQSVLSAVTDIGTSVGPSVVTEVSANEGASYETAQLTKPDGTTSSALTAVGAGWARIPGGFTHVRQRLTALTSGSGVTGRLTSSKGI